MSKPEKKILIPFIIALAVVASVSLVFYFQQKDTYINAAGENWLSGWSYRKPVTVTNSNAAASGTINGNTTMGVSGKFDTALSFDGAGDYVTFADSDDWVLGTSDFTIDFWVKFNSDTGDQAAVGQYVDSNNLWGVYFDGGERVRFLCNIGGATKAYMWGAFNPDINTWYHVAVVRNGANAYMFINGTAATLTTATAFGTNDLSNLSATLNVGAWTGYALNGQLDELRISKGIARWTSNFTPSTAEYSPDSYTKLLLHLDETSGATVSSDSSLINYQVPLTVTYDSKMQSDFDDLRFTSSDGSTLLNYWLESKTDSSSAKIWVKVPMLAYGDNTIYMYYGNSSAVTSSSGDDTFVFFDDFTGYSFDSSKWTTLNSPTVSSGYASFRATSSWQSVVSTGYVSDDIRSYEIYTRYRIIDNSEQRIFYGWADSTSPSTVSCSYAYSYNNLYPIYGYNPASVAWTLNSWYASRVVLSSSYYPTVSLVEGGAASATATQTVASSQNKVFLGTIYGGGDFDWVFVRKHALSEPVSVFGLEYIVTSRFLIKKEDGCSCSLASECYSGGCISNVCGTAGPTATNLSVPSD